MDSMTTVVLMCIQSVHDCAMYSSILLFTEVDVLAAGTMILHNTT